MLKPLPLYIGLRYLHAKRKTQLVSFITLSSITGLVLSIAVLITVLSVINGFERELQQRILGLIPHAKLYAYKPFADWQTLAGQLDRQAGVLGAAPFVEMQGMLSLNNQVKPVFVTGIDPAYETKVSIIQQFMKEGSLDVLAPGEFGMVMDVSLAQELALRIGDKVTLVLPETAVSPAGLLPRFKRFTLKATFATSADVGQFMVLVHMQDAALVLREKGLVHGLRLKLADLFSAPQLSWRLGQDLAQGFYASDWTRNYGSLYQAIRMQKGMIALLLVLIVAVAVFNIVASLIMVVNDKKADIAILRTLGLSSWAVMRVFMVQALFIGLIGCSAGLLLGVLISLVLSDIYSGFEALFNLKLMESYFIHYLPTEIRVADVLMIFAGGIVMTLLAAVYPAWRATQTEPALELRHE